MSETQLDRLERKFDAFVEYTQSEFVSVRGEIAEVRSELAEVKKDVSEVKKEVAEVKKEVAEVKIDIAGIKSEIVDLREDQQSLRAEVRAMRTEFQERFESLSDRARLVESRLAAMALEQSRLRQSIETGLTDVRGEIEQVRMKIEGLESATLDNSLRIMQLRDDMQQRFRVVNERISGVEKQLAA